MEKDRGVSPLIATLLLIALTVSITVLYTTVATDLITVYDSEDYDLPTVETESREGNISVQILDKGDMSSVVVGTPESSGLEDTYVSTVGKKSTFKIKEKDTGTYSVSALNPDGQKVLLDNIRVNKSVEEFNNDDGSNGSVEDLELILLENTVEGGEDSIRFDIKNTGDSEVSITDFKVEKENLRDLSINTETPPSPDASRSESEIFIESTPENGFCGLPKPKSIDIGEKERFNNCKSESRPSVASSGATMSTTFNGIDADKATEYIGVSPSPDLTDMSVSLYGTRDQSITVPLILDTFVVPKDGSYLYEQDIKSDRFENDPGTILVLEDTKLKGEIKGIDSSVYMSQNSTTDNEIGNIRAVTGANGVVINDDISNARSGVFLGDNSEVSKVKASYSLRLGENSEVTGSVENIERSVRIGYNSEVQKLIKDVDNGVYIGEQSSIGPVDDVSSIDIGSESTLTAEINAVQGDAKIGSNTVAENEIDGVSGDITIGSGSRLEDDLGNVGGDAVIGTGTETSTINTVGGDLILKDNVDVDGSISSITGDVICGDNVETNSNACEKDIDNYNNGNGNNGNGNNGNGNN